MRGTKHTGSAARGHPRQHRQSSGVFRAIDTRRKHCPHTLPSMASKHSARRADYNREPWWRREYGGAPVWMLIVILLLGGGAVAIGIAFGSG